ncbi:MAG: methyltransferase domain-containing protein [Oscillospiraceae bacterium]|nr:methyltransferase domain-containing protein [Oscillospiraceae bacterium]
MPQENILRENRIYWTGRASGYSEVNQTELGTEQHRKWRSFLREEMEKCFPNKAPEDLQVLDIGTGPGFFAVLLCELGCCVTAVDLTPAMLDEAKKNAGPLADRIRFLEMNAEALSFESECFDTVISRNLTWNLPHPERAYSDWVRVLKPGGLLLNFDANWYSYLFDEAAQAAYEQDRVNTARLGVRDENIGEHFDVMEEIARRVPLSAIRRPEWDLSCLRSLGLRAEANEEVWKQLWSEEEKLNFSSTPMFMIRAEKIRSKAERV